MNTNKISIKLHIKSFLTKNGVNPELVVQFIYTVSIAKSLYKIY